MNRANMNEPNEIISERQSTRAAGRVGGTKRLLSLNSILRRAPEKPYDVMTLYCNLFALRDQEECEFSKAITYGLKLLQKERAVRRDRAAPHGDQA
jgi:hypothetical protein